MALDHENTSPSDHTSDSSLVHPSQDTNSLAALVRSGRIGRVVVVGAGVAGALTTEMLLGMAEHARQSLRVVLVDDGRYGPSDGSGGWFMPFANPDPRVERWAQDSFDMWDTVLNAAELDSYRRRMASLMVSNHPDRVPVPPGHPGHSSPIDPGMFDLGFWARGAYIDDGAVLSTCALMPMWRRRLAAHPSVVTVTNHLTGPNDISAIAESFSADVVIVTAGPRARFLLDDERVEADFGVLLRGALRQLPEMYKHIVIMDEDRDNELAYSIPHHECGHVLFGGVCGDIVEDAREFEQIRAGNVDLTMAPDFARTAIDEVYARISERMPALAAALPNDPTQPGAYWFGLRPRASRVITEWRPTAGAPMLVIGGLGGSGFTIGPAVVLDALRLPLPPECQVRPGNTKAEEED